MHLLALSRAGLPNLFSMKEGIAALRPLGDLGSLQGPTDTEQAEEPVLLQNLQTFLTEKLQLADRYAR